MNDRELMQMALEALQESKPIDINDPTAFYRSAHAIEALRVALAQPEPEPVWVEVTTNTGDKFILDSAVEADKIKAARDVGLSVVPLYMAPPQREWHGLTDEEILADDVLRYHFGLSGGAGPVSKNGKAIVAAVEAKLRRKIHDKR